MKMKPLVKIRDKNGRLSRLAVLSIITGDAVERNR